ncbi:MAG TPA: DUF4037 domain-containing protein [Clostridia bacterium]|nr:DUF4037 domain-containing protein [Clostridia bacterium]
MNISIKDKIEKLLDKAASIDGIWAIGQTGDINEVPRPGESDIDIFVLGDRIPGYEERKALYYEDSSLFESCTMNVCEGGYWGTGDVFLVDGVETMLMYFTIGDTLKYVDEVLDGRHPDCDNGFYPVGRLATLKNINILYDEKGIFASLKEKLSVYPDKLKKALVSYHIRLIYDEEDFGRALLRKDVLFYHRVLETALDHYLQALYAANETYFPSRKRTRQYIDSFSVKPKNCYERMLEAIKLGSSSEGIKGSDDVWCGLVRDLKVICSEI